MNRFAWLSFRAKRKFRVPVLLAALCVGLSGAALPPQDFNLRLEGVAGEHGFDFVRWEAGAIAHNLAARFQAAEPLDAPSARQTIVRFFDTGRDISQLDAELNQTASADSHAAGLAGLEERLRQVRSERSRLRPPVQATVQRQIESVLDNLGFRLSLLDRHIVFPPVWFTFSRLPLLLVVSPREKIERKAQLYLVPELTTDQMEGIEAQVDGLGVSSLIVPLGGVSTYPAMIGEGSSLDFTIYGASHEWMHNYLTLRPLGWSFGDTPETVVLNEVVADIAGHEIGDAVMARFYPRQPPGAGPPGDATAPQPASPSTLDFNREMRTLRLAVDQLLAEGKAEAAEGAMEEKRRFLVSHGYYIRKLNQAYFAFYGSYASGPAGSVDPVVEEIQRFRRASPSLKTFVDRMAAATSYEAFRSIARQAAAGK